MKERQKRTEAIIAGVSLLGLVAVSFGAFTKSQRDWILNRDGNRCQFPVDDNKGGIKKCGVSTNLAAHHIEPQRYAESIGLDQDREVDIPENGITLGTYHHNKVIHPDMQDTFADYRRQKKLGVDKPDSFKRMFGKRDKQVNRGEKYWVDDYDEALSEIAQENTDNHDKPFPSKHRRTTKNRKGKPWYSKLF